jgi:GAF domain-containing protein
MIPFKPGPDMVSPIILLTIFVMDTVLVTFALRDLTTALRRARSDERALAENLSELEISRTALVTRTRDLERRSVQLQTAAEIARDATTARDLGELLNRAASLIHSRFNYYYVGIFLIEEVGAGRARTQDVYAVLRAATGEAGEQLLEQGHRLQVGGISMVGIATATGQPRIAQDISSDAMRFENPLLPETRAEMALPLQVGGRVIGALDVQSREPAAFGSDEVTILQTMADQLAVAIQNTQLLNQMRQTVRELEMVSGRYTRESWRETIEDAGRMLGYRYLKSGIEPIIERPSSGNTPEDEYTAIVPIRFRDAVIGTFNLRSSEDDISEEALLLVQGVAERLTLALENARLLEETRQRAAWEQTLSEMTARFTRSLDTDTLLRTAVRELGQLLQMDEIAIHIGAPGAPVQADEPQA